MASHSTTAVTSVLSHLSPFGTPRSRADWLADALVFLVCLGFLPFAPLAHLTESNLLLAAVPDWWLVPEWVFGSIACLSLWWRRDHPVAVAILLAPLGGFFLSAGAPAVISVYTVASRGRLRVAIAVAVAHLAIALPYFSLLPGFWEDQLLWTVNVVIVYVLTLSIGLTVRSRHQVIAGLRESGERDRREFEGRLARTRGDERRQIAREMHDALAHRISLLSVHAGALDYRLSGGAAGEHTLSQRELRDGIATIRRTAHLALEDLHQVLDLLKDADTAAELSRGVPQPRASDLPALISDARAAGQPVRWRQESDRATVDRLPPRTQRTVYRVVQEGLTNARKHTPGAQVELAVTGSPDDGLQVEVCNALPVGTTATEIPGAGSGLIGLAERVAMDGGVLLHRVDGDEFVLTAELPWPATEETPDE